MSAPMRIIWHKTCWSPHLRMTIPILCATLGPAWTWLRMIKLLRWRPQKRRLKQLSNISISTWRGQRHKIPFLSLLLGSQPGCLAGRWRPGGRSLHYVAWSGSGLWLCLIFECCWLVCPYITNIYALQIHFHISKDPRSKLHEIKWKYRHCLFPLLIISFKRIAELCQS